MVVRVEVVRMVIICHCEKVRRPYVILGLSYLGCRTQPHPSSSLPTFTPPEIISHALRTSDSYLTMSSFAPILFKSEAFAAALYYDTEKGPQTIGGNEILPGAVDPVNVRLLSHLASDSSPTFGFRLSFLTSDSPGFGHRHRPSDGAVTNNYSIRVTFPRDGFQVSSRPLPPEIHTRLAPDSGDDIDNTDLPFVLITVQLEPGKEIGVEGFAMPFFNDSKEIMSWLNEDAPIAGFRSLTSILAQREFTFLANAAARNLLGSLPLMPPPFEYPYTKTYSWSMRRYKSEIPKNSGHQFTGKVSFESDHHMLTALSQSQAQDVFQLAQDASEISRSFFKAAIVVNGNVDKPNALADIYITPLGFNALTAMARVTAVAALHQNHREGKDYTIPQSLLRDFMMGNGFWTTCQMMKRLSPGAPDRSQGPQLPVHNFLSTPHTSLANALVDCALPQDRQRFRDHISAVPLGIVGILGFAGSGKTQCLAAVVLIMCANPQLKKIFASAPTNVAVSNMAERIYNLSCTIADKGVSYEEPTPRVYKPLLVIRAYNIQDEITAFVELCRGNHRLWNGIDHGKNTSNGTKWSPNLSVAWWMARLFGITRTGIPPPSEGDPYVLVSMRREIIKNKSLGEIDNCIRQQGKERGKGPKINRSDLCKVMINLVMRADVVCTTPFASTSEPYTRFKTRARAVAVDEAGAMDRTDALVVWGNSCRPFVMAGDPKQLPPTVMSAGDVDASGHHLNRFSEDGSISILEFALRSGWPMYALHTQLRMAIGMFDLSLHNVYPELRGRFSYGVETNEDHHPVGLAVEDWVSRTYNKHSRPGTLEPLFLHVEGSICEKSGTSRYNPVQASVASRLIRAVLHGTHGKVKASDFAVITPYRSNRAHVSSLFEKDECLAKIPVYTIDAIQGREADIVVFIMTVNADTGPGFVADLRRLNVAMTRQKSYLFIGHTNMDASFAWSSPVTSPRRDGRLPSWLDVDASSQISGIEEALADSALADEFLIGYEGSITRPQNSPLRRDLKALDDASIDNVREAAEGNAGNNYNSASLVTTQETENRGIRGENIDVVEGTRGSVLHPDLGVGTDTGIRDLEAGLHQSRLRPTSPPHHAASDRDPATNPEDAATGPAYPQTPQARPPATTSATASAGPSPATPDPPHNRSTTRPAIPPSQPPPQSQVIQFQIVDSDNFAIRFSIRRHRTLGRAMRIFSDRSGSVFDTLRFMHELQRVHESSTPNTLDMEEGDEILVFRELLGGMVCP
ncbi:hypothetical protein ACRALDRAFT_1081301 [Sodiomyces alcalophilus JCM 7366]|uniref:uncharacterized protein n=1 Tax=Sodiomyces alcalophilus JCM 7366 TaxID=591952 RepID=UPI0039B5690B